MNRHRRPWRALLVATLLISIAACGSGDSSSSATSPPAEADGGDSTRATDDPLAPRPLAERQTLTVTIPIKIEAFAQLLLADEFGEFDKENLDIDLQTLPGNEAITLLGAERADVQTGGPSTTMFNAIASDFDIAWGASNYHPAETSKGGLWLASDLFGPDGEPDPDKVKGATIAFGGLGMAGTPTLYLVSDWLESIGLTLDDINEQNINGADMIVALENGSIDGGWILDPFWLQLEDSDAARFVIGQPDAVGGYMLGPTRHDKAEAIDAFFRAMLRTTRTYLSGDYHRDEEVVTALAELTEVDPDTITATPALEFVQDMRIDPTVAERLQEQWFDLGLMSYDEPLAVDRYVDQTSVERVLAGE